jgi:hypothetical protein
LHDPVVRKRIGEMIAWAMRLSKRHGIHGATAFHVVPGAWRVGMAPRCSRGEI